MTATRRDRGRPPVFDNTLRDKYLAAVTAGMHLGDAAAHVGLHRNHPTRLARTDRQFAAALQEARELGKKARLEDLDHDESRYNHHKCRCPRCTTAAAEARTNRRHAAADDPGGQVLDLPPATTDAPIPLARAS